MTNDSNKERHPLRASLRTWLVGLSLAAVSLIAFLFLLDFLLRTFPALLPAGIYRTEVFDPDLNTTVFSSPAIYNKVRYVVRMPNRDGFLDVDHPHTKPSGVKRVGFWGDSYVEAVQAPLEQTFWRRLSRKMSAYEIETLAFGRSGWGTLHSLLAYRKYGKRYDIDIVIHLFVKNDPGDHLFKIQQAKNLSKLKPSAVLADNDAGYEIRWQRYPNDWPFTHFLHRLTNWRAAPSLLMGVCLGRAELALRSRRRGKTGDNIPNQNDPPSTWPVDILSEAKLLTKRIFSHMRDEVRSEGKHFAVLYVPRYTKEITGQLPVDDRWYPWLAVTLADLGIPLIDPTDALRARFAEGDAVYDDHWTPAGHEVIATVLAKYLSDYFARNGSQ